MSKRTFQPNNRRRAKTHGFRLRMRTRAGRAILSARRAKGRHRLSASEDYCWNSWPKQIASLARLLDVTFEWILPGHGQRLHLTSEAMREELRNLVERLRRT